MPTARAGRIWALHLASMTLKAIFVSNSLQVGNSPDNLCVSPRGGGEHEPWFVAAKDIERNTLTVVQGHDHPLLLSPALVADDLSWIAGHAPTGGMAAAKTRYRQADAPCSVGFDAAGRLALRFTDPQWAVTPGQSAVLYDGDVCLGGGVIAAALPA
jgi:tRNA-specific 2-thiouridylase